MMEGFFSLDLLINRVEELQRLDQLETIQNLTRKNSLLQEVVTEYQRQWYCTIDLIEKTQEAVFILQEAIQHFNVETEAAERVWLALWGIERPEADLQTCNPAGWI
jgi:hypothetical protein